ncbi:hypothetical protein [Sulfolobus spindle-shaped virus SSV19]|nr:hypothetical protein [Sulfolobus spindle-shaped virus SSV19]
MRGFYHVVNRADTRKIHRIRGNHRYNIYYYLFAVQKIKEQIRTNYRESARYKIVRLLSGDIRNICAVDSSLCSIRKLFGLLLRPYTRFISVLHGAQAGDEE